MTGRQPSFRCSTSTRSNYAPIWLPVYGKMSTVEYRIALSEGIVGGSAQHANKSWRGALHIEPRPYPVTWGRRLPPDRADRATLNLYPKSSDQIRFPTAWNAWCMDSIQIHESQWYRGPLSHSRSLFRPIRHLARRIYMYVNQSFRQNQWDEGSFSCRWIANYAGQKGKDDELQRIRTVSLPPNMHIVSSPLTNPPIIVSNPVVCYCRTKRFPRPAPCVHREAQLSNNLHSTKLPAPKPSWGTVVHMSDTSRLSNWSTAAIMALLQWGNRDRVIGQHLINFVT